jgi:hypothetical protein
MQLEVSPPRSPPRTSPGRACTASCPPPPCPETRPTPGGAASGGSPHAPSSRRGSGGGVACPGTSSGLAAAERQRGEAGARQSGGEDAGARHGVSEARCERRGGSYSDVGRRRLSGDSDSDSLGAHGARRERNGLSRRGVWTLRGRGLGAWDFVDEWCRGRVGVVGERQVSQVKYLLLPLLLMMMMMLARHPIPCINKTHDECLQPTTSISDVVSSPTFAAGIRHYNQAQEADHRVGGKCVGAMRQSGHHLGATTDTRSLECKANSRMRGVRSHGCTTSSTPTRCWKK